MLVVGATGMLGGEVCRLLREQGREVKALVRDGADEVRVGRLRALGAELVQGDLKDRASLERACAGVDAIVCTASSTLSRRAGDSIESVDHRGLLDLIEAAEAAGVTRFVLVSFPPIELRFPLQDAKRAAEDRLRGGAMSYTVLQPTCFMDVWLTPALGFDPRNGRARIHGEGRNPLSWIWSGDVARSALAALEHPAAANAIVELGGPDALSPVEVVRLAEEILGRRIEVEHVPEQALRGMYAAATDPLQQSLAALALYCAGGDAIDMRHTGRAFGLTGLRRVADHLRSLTG